MGLNRLSIRGKLALLLVLPLIAVLAVATPLVVGLVDDARTAARIATQAKAANQVGELVWELQRELLLTSAYVAQPNAVPGPVLDQQAAVTAAAGRVRSELGAAIPDELDRALIRIGSLEELRVSALSRGASLDSLARTYHAVTEAVIDALRLNPSASGSADSPDAVSTQTLSSLDTLLRGNEQSALRNTALITSSVSPAAGQRLLEDATKRAQILTQEFVQDAGPEHAALIVQVDQDDFGRYVEALSKRIPPAADRAATASFVSEALSAAEAQGRLRRVAQDRVTAEIAAAAVQRGQAAERLAVGVGVGAAVLVMLVLALSALVSRSIARPLRRLTSSAGEVADLARSELTRVADSEADEQQIPHLAEVSVSAGGEVGALASAFNRVQSTAAELLERQVTNRHNVSLMFANVARRTQNLVLRQLAVVDELERNEQDPVLLRGLYQLDHMSTRLRRSADKLLVVAGAREHEMSAEPIELATALRSALAEIEDYKRVRLGNVAGVTLASTVAADAVLLFAELLENATSFSPPDSIVDLNAVRRDGSCLVMIVDHGVGMPAQELELQNQRLVERERLDIAPTGVLGLFVVGRLARRHGMSITLVETPGGGITALVRIPAEQFHRSNEPRPVAPTPLAATLPAGAIPAPRDGSDFWFEPTTRTPATGRPPVPMLPAAAPPLPPPPAVPPIVAPRHSPAPAASTPPANRPGAPAPAPPAASPADQRAAPNRNGLRRRVPGAQLHAAADGAPRHASPVRQPQPADPAAAQRAMDGYQSGVAEAARHRGPRPGPAAPSTPPTEEIPTPVRRHAAAAPAWSPPPTADESSRGGLTRRRPGAHLAPGLRVSGKSPARDGEGDGGGGWVVRDADAERTAFDAFATAFARAEAPAPPINGSTPRKEKTR